VAPWATRSQCVYVTLLLPARDLSPAEWIVADLKTFAKSVISLVPSGFPSYVRIFHPAWRDPYSRQPVRWAEIAAANGTSVTPAMQLHALAHDLRYLHEGQPGVYAAAPTEGSLPDEVVTPLIEVLAAHTTTAEKCWFAFWNGFGGTRADVRSAPTFTIPGRTYHLLTGPLEAARESAVLPPFSQSPNLWWPDDRVWCVATEIDLNTTYIGCDDPCRQAILKEPALEALLIDAAAGIDWRSDPVNPFPGE
jgi:hypothetical protein